MRGPKVVGCPRSFVRIALVPHFCYEKLRGRFLSSRYYCHRKHKWKTNFRPSLHGVFVASKHGGPKSARVAEKGRRKPSQIGFLWSKKNFSLDVINIPVKCGFFRSRLRGAGAPINFSYLYSRNTVNWGLFCTVGGPGIITPDDAELKFSGYLRIYTLILYAL